METFESNPINPVSDIRFDARIPRQWFRKHPQLEEAIKHTVSAQIENGLFKCKFATAVRWSGAPILECRVNEKSVGAVRVAFAIKDGICTILYISGTVQKKAFTAELERFLRN